MRLITRGDLDGLVSTVLLTTMEEFDRIELVHPQHITDNMFVVKDTDVLTKLPYHPNCAMWFSHRQITESNARPPANLKGAHMIAPSSSRVIYNHYASPRLKRFESLVEAADKLESASLAPADIEDPQEAILLGFIMDPRTSFGAYKVFFKSLAQRLKKMELKDLMAEPDVADRIKVYKERQEEFKDLLRAHSCMEDHVVVTDFRPLEGVPIGNRFMIYALYPDSNVSLRLQWGPTRNFVAATMGRSIFNRSCTVNIGNLCSDFGGGGHEGAGSVPIEIEGADEQIREIINLLNGGTD